MREETVFSDEEKADLACRLNEMLSVMSYFTRQTIMEWTPEIAAKEMITPERFMLMYELKLQPNMSLKQLANIAMIAPPNLSPIIQDMVSAGLILREKDVQDRRRVQLRLTEEGEAKIERGEKILTQNFEAYLKCIPDSYVKELDDATSSMLEIMNKITKMKKTRGI